MKLQISIASVSALLCAIPAAFAYQVQSPRLSLVSSLYKGESVVLTGATGFVGLRTLKTLLMHTDADNIILPIRVKGDLRDEETALDRFAHVISKYGDGLDLSIQDPRLCVVPMSSGKYLDGISHAPKSILGKCSTILHVAGSTDWDIPIDELISTNLEPTLDFLKGSSSSDILPNLKSFVFSSTSFAEDKDNVSRYTPVPEGPLAKVSDSSNYFSNYAKVKALTEHAIESWVKTDCENDNMRVAIVRPGIVSPSMGLDDVPVARAFMGGKTVKTFSGRKGVDTGVIPVDHVANMLVLTGGNSNLKGKNGKPFYLNACLPSKQEAKWDTLFERDGMKVPEDEITYKNSLKQALLRAETELGCSKREMMVFQAISKAYDSLARVTFHDWAFETNNQAMLFEGLCPEYRMMMPIAFADREEMKAWVDEIMHKIGGKKKVVNEQQRKKSVLESGLPGNSMISNRHNTEEEMILIFS